MAFKVELHTDAEIELDETITYYPISIGLKFRAVVKKSLLDISGQPNRWPVMLRHRGFQVRKRMIPRFPHKIIYTEHPQGTILILAIAHGKREPGYWMERIPDNDSD